MDQITVRQTSADLPVFDEDVDLESVSSLHTSSGLVSDFQFSDASLSALDLENVTLLHGKFRALQAARATITGGRLDSVEFTSCDLAGSLFDDCDLRLTDFGQGSYRGCDLRGNDLSALCSTRHLKNVIIDRAQTMQLAEALAAELNVTFGDDIPDPP
jgi:uncharacterized protein YjbI with pentapeptide repeats